MLARNLSEGSYFKIQEYLAQSWPALKLVLQQDTSSCMCVCVCVCVFSVKLHCVLVGSITHGTMGVENQRPEDIKVAGRESWTNCECRMLEHLIL